MILELDGHTITLGPKADAAIKEAREQGVI